MTERTDRAVVEMLPTTPSQTVGPFLSIGLDWGPGGSLVVPGGTPGAFWIRGEILDGAGDPITDALVETWQAAPDGLFDHPDDPRGRTRGWQGLGRSDTRLGQYAIHTVLPGFVPTRDGRPQAPHIDVSVFARGMLHRVVTRIYFPDHPETNATDPILATVPEDRRHTLCATPSFDGYRFDIRLQGPGETVFFHV